MAHLFSPVTIGSIELPNRVFMAPLTRMRATAPGDVPNDLMLEHYRQRAGAGLIFSEGAQISPEGKGYADTPGIHSDEQVAAWRRITDAVHQAGGRIAIQLWHTGRVSHGSLHGGALPVSASAVAFRNRTSLKDDVGRVVRANCPTPRALEITELPRLIDDYHRAGANARAAGFDFVEIHGAHGYLLHQFMSELSNHRTDAYGGALENRARLPLEVLDAVIDAWDADHVGMRISPLGIFNGLDDAAGQPMGLHLARAFAERDLAFLHLSEPDWAGGPQHDATFREQLRAAYPGTIIGAGNYTVEKAQRLIGAGLIDAAAFGRAFIANPDLPTRLAAGAPLTDPEPSTFYGGGAEGYTDYPRYELEKTAGPPSGPSLRPPRPAHVQA